MPSEDQKFSTKEGIEIEVQIFEDGLVDGYKVLDFVVYIRVPSYELTDSKFESRFSGGDLEIYTVQRRN